MVDREELITSRQMMVLMISAMIGASIISLPAKLAEEVGHDGWISILISGFIAVVMSVIVINLLKKHKNKSIFQINTILYGKWAGGIINILYVVYLILKTSINVRIMVEVIQTIVLRSTPAIVLTIFEILPTVYISWYGFKPICRYAYTVYLTIAFVLLLFILQLKMLHPTFLLPVMECSIPSLIDSVRTNAYAFLMFAYPWLVYPIVTDKENALKYTISALVFSTLFFLCSVLFTTAFFGENMLKHLSFPLYSVARVYKAPIFERIDLFFMVIWFPAMHMSTKAYYYGTGFWVMKLFNIKRKTIFLLIYTAVIVAVSRLPGNMSIISKYLEFVDMIGVLLIIFMAILGYIITLFKFRRGSKA